MAKRTEMIHNTNGTDYEVLRRHGDIALLKVHEYNEYVVVSGIFPNPEHPDFTCWVGGNYYNGDIVGAFREYEILHHEKFDDVDTFPW